MSTGLVMTRSPVAVPGDMPLVMANVAPHGSRLSAAGVEATYFSPGSPQRPPGILLLSSSTNISRRRQHQAPPYPERETPCQLSTSKGSTASRSATRSARTRSTSTSPSTTAPRAFLSGPHFLDKSKNDDEVTLQRDDHFSDKIRIRLKERDGERGGNNDLDLGTKAYDKTELTNGGDAVFGTDGVSYAMDYRITA